MSRLILGVIAAVLGAGSAANAAECPDLVQLASRAHAAYQDVELQEAKRLVDEGYAALTCQDRPVSTEALLELYRLDALVALSRDDGKTLTFATIRALAAQHVGGRPPDKYGPDLQAQYDTWAARLAEDLVTIRVIDEGTAWVDGRPVDAAHPLEAVAGEHLVQLPLSPDAPDTVRSEVRDLAGDAALLTGVGAVVPVPEPVPMPVLPLPLPAPLPEPVPEPLPDRSRRHPMALAITGAATGLLAAVSLGSALYSESQFRGSPYLANDFYGCPRGAACYASARERAIRVDARRIDIAYGVGYGLTAVTGGLTLVTVVGLPARR